ncbi:MAG: LytR/AlgR family response regulator transcription factor [Lautropia sp.]
MPATAVIADDEAPLRDFLRKRLAALWPELRIVAEARNGIEAAALIASHAPAVAFLDIKMPGLSGLEVAQGIRTATRVVFVTAFDQYALDAFEREAVDYLVKPVAVDRLARTVARLQRALREAAAPPPLAGLLAALLQRAGGLAGGGAAGGAPPGGRLRWIRASRGDTTVHVPVDEIRYVRSDDKYTVVHTRDGEHLIRTALADLAAELDPERFWQIHRSTIVNMDQVAATRRDDNGRLYVVIRDGGVELPVSRAYAQRFRQM